MKKLLIFILCFGWMAARSQVIVNRSPISIVSQDANLNATFSFKIPVFADTTTATLYIAHDSLGKMFYNMHDSLVYVRTVNASGTKKWQPVGNGSGGAVSSVFGRAGGVVALTGDYAAFYPSLAGSYADPAWITSLAATKIAGGQTVTPGSSKIALTGTPAGAALQPFAIDVVPSNINLTALGGLLGIAQINASGSPSNTTFLRGDGTWSSPGTTVTGLPNSNVGSGYRLTFPATNNVRTLFTAGYAAWDSTSNSNALTLTIDTSAGKLATKTDINRFVNYNLDSVLSHGGQLSADRTSNFNTHLWNITNAVSLTVGTSGNNNLGTHGAAMFGNNNYDGGGLANFIFGSTDSLAGSGGFNLVAGFNNKLLTGSPGDNAVFGSSNTVGNQQYNLIAGENNISTGNDNIVAGNTDSSDNSANFIAGNQNRAQGGYSFLVGQFNKTNRAYQNAFGIFNDTAGHYYALMIGNGTSNAARKNSFAVDTAGFVYNKGLVNANGFTFINPTDGISDTLATRAFARTFGGGGGGGGGGNPFLDNTALIKNNADNSKQAIFSAASITTATTRTYTLPDVNGTVDLQANTATLTNKTISATTNTITNLTNTNLNGAAAISNANMHAMAPNTRLGNITGGSAVPTDVTAAQETAALNAFTASLQGLVPASGGGLLNYLRADGSWVNPTTGVDTFTLRTPGTGPGAIPLAFTNPVGVLTIPKIAPGTNITFGIGADSLVTINSSGGGGSAADSVQVYTSGSTLTQATLANYIQVNPASVQAALTITTATSANWPASNNLRIVIGGTLTSGTAITTFSLVGGAGLTVIDDIPPNTLMVGHVLDYHRIGTFIYRIKD